MWKHVVVGTVLAFKPSFTDVQQWAKVNWKQFNPKIVYIKPGIYLLEFQTEEDKLVVLGRRWSFYHKSPVTFKAWDPSLELDDIDFSKIPVWVQLPNLKTRFWTSKGLSKITSYLRIPITTDILTANRSRVNFARVLVEVDVKSYLPDVILITGPEGEKLVQSVRYEFRMPKFSMCNMIGHLSEQCRKKKANDAEKTTGEKNVKADKNAQKHDVAVLSVDGKYEGEKKAAETIYVSVVEEVTMTSATKYASNVPSAVNKISPSICCKYCKF